MSDAEPLDPCRALLVRYGEIGLKGANRPMFERVLGDNLKHALDGVPGLRVHRVRGRLRLHSDLPAEELAGRASRVFGLTSLSPAREVGSEAEAILAAARGELVRALREDWAGQSDIPFRVAVNRAAKGFPMTSAEMERWLADQLLPDHGERLRVDLSNPSLKLEVDLRNEGSWVFARRIQGPGGLPVGTMGRVHCLLSGGIDSPVAAWECMKRGMRVELVSFYSFPLVGPQTREKIIRLAQELAQWQPRTILHLVPFADYQTAIRDHCPEPYRTVLYRRAMQRIASSIAWRRKGKALVTGESVGQVASQTLENLRVIEEASRLPVLRPLVTADKQQIIAQARRIGTYRISNLPAPDCCTVFQPESPVIYGRLAAAQAAEEALDLHRLTLDAVRGTERLSIPSS